MIKQSVPKWHHQAEMGYIILHFALWRTGRKQNKITIAKYTNFSKVEYKW